VLSGQSLLVRPYVQPGLNSTLQGNDSKKILWLTDQVPGEFSVEFSGDNFPNRTVTPERVKLDFGPAKSKSSEVEHEQHYFKYTATVDGLPFDRSITYRVKQSGKEIGSGTFQTTATAGKTIRFVMVGDLANGDAGQDAVAAQILKVDPAFVVALGDIVYPSGRVSQYQDHFWRTYNPIKGPSLMASIPFHVVLGNHDVDTHNLLETPDVLGAYHFFQAPANGPGEGAWSTPLGTSPAATTFRQSVGSSYPSLGVYSFDHGPAHFLILDNNGYSKLDSPKMLEWIERDLTSSRAPWKFVCMHAPIFHSSREHYNEQKSRLLAPLLERLGADLVCSGHVHNYQRSRPIRFTPDAAQVAPGGLVNGTFKIDTVFDCVTNTRPDGLIHLVAGGGGGTLYKGELEKNAAYFQSQKPGNWVPYTAKFVADRHSFTVFELTQERLLLRAIDATGGEIDRVILTKPAR
jgi:3',5'-cyclic AMP phosphodiesterase CpdA